MITGSIWEKEVFGVWLFAPAVLLGGRVQHSWCSALHTAYLARRAAGWLGATGQMLLALAAYATYVVNAAQFILKLRAARLARTGGEPRAPVRRGGAMNAHRRLAAPAAPSSAAAPTARCCASAASARCSAG